jgi:hypothetical protein
MEDGRRIPIRHKLSCANCEQECIRDRGDNVRITLLNGNMPRMISERKKRPSIEAQLALAERVLRGINKSIDVQIQRAQDLEVERALALYKSGKATLQDGKEVIEQARLLVG